MILQVEQHPARDGVGSRGVLTRRDRLVLQHSEYVVGPGQSANARLPASMASGNFSRSSKQLIRSVDYLTEVA